MTKRLTKAILLSIILMAGTWGCSSVRMTMTTRSILEQQLLVQGLERAVNKFDLEPFKGKRVSLNVTGLSKDEVAFTDEYLKIQLARQGIQFATDQAEVELNLRVLAPVLAVDQSEILFGTPEFSLLGIPIPAIVIYRKVSNKGRAEIEMYVYDAKAEKMMAALPPVVGETNYDRYTVLFIFSWTSTDLEKTNREKGVTLMHTKG
jgi:hypothetical protein